MAAKSSGHGGKREGAGRPRSKRDDVAVKIDRTLVSMAKFVANRRGVTLAEFVTDMLRPGVEREWGKEVKKIEGEHK